MKKAIVFLSLLGLAVSACNNAAPAPENSDAAVAAESKSSDFIPSKAEVDSVSYLVGVNFGSFIKGYNFGDDLNYSQIVKGIKDFVAAEGDFRSPDFASQFKYDPQSMNNAFNSYLEKRQKYTIAVNKEEGEKFLAENASKDSVQVAESGLQYKIVAAGNDVKMPKGNPKELLAAMRSGQLDRAAVRRSAGRIVETMLKFRVMRKEADSFSSSPSPK